MVVCDRNLEPYLVRAEDARGFTHWLVRWQQWRLNAMYGAEEEIFVRPVDATPYQPEHQAMHEGPVSPSELAVARRINAEATAEEAPVPRGYREFRDPVEDEQRSAAKSLADEEADATPDYDSRVRGSLAKGNRAVWSANATGASAAACYQTGASDALARPGISQGASCDLGGVRAMHPSWGSFFGLAGNDI